LPRGNKRLSVLRREEISLWKTHLVVLGNHERIDNRPYDSDPAKVLLFIQEMNKQGLPVIASLPEYWWYHWPSPPQTISLALPPGVSDPDQPTGGTSTYQFIRSGITGFEIINSAPKALDFPIFLSPKHRS